MALTEELPIYRATYRLLNMLLRATQDFLRFYRYSLGTRMVDVCLDMSMLLRPGGCPSSAGYKYQDFQSGKRERTTNDINE